MTKLLVNMPANKSRYRHNELSVEYLHIIHLKDRKNGDLDVKKLITRSISNRYRPLNRATLSSSQVIQQNSATVSVRRTESSFCVFGSSLCNKIHKPQL